MPLKPDLIGQRDTRLSVGGFLGAVSYRIPLPVTKVVCFPAPQYSHPLCPRCNAGMDREYMRFCDRCGQKLNWDYIDHAQVIIAPVK